MSAQLYDRQIVWKQYVGRKSEDLGRQLISDEDRRVRIRSRGEESRIARSVSSMETVRAPLDGWQRRREERTVYFTSPGCSVSSWHKKAAVVSAAAARRDGGRFVAKKQPAPSYSSILATRKAASLRSGWRSSSPTRTTLLRGRVDPAASISASERLGSALSNPPTARRNARVAVPSRTDTTTRWLDKHCSRGGQPLVDSGQEDATPPARTSSGGFNRTHRRQISLLSGGSRDSVEDGISKSPTADRSVNKGRQGRRRMSASEQQQQRRRRSNIETPTSTEEMVQESDPIVVRVDSEKQGERTAVGNAVGNINKDRSLETAAPRRKKHAPRKVEPTKSAANHGEAIEDTSKVASPVGRRLARSVNGVDGSNGNDGSRGHAVVRGGGGRGKGSGSSSDTAGHRSSIISTASPSRVTQSFVANELARKEREWDRERSQLLTVIKFQHKQLSRSTSERLVKKQKALSASSEDDMKPIGSTVAAAAAENDCTKTDASAMSATCAAWPLPPLPPAAQPLTTTALLSASAPVHDRSGHCAARATVDPTASAGTTNAGTNNEDAWSTGPEEEEGFAFSSSERTQLLCKVELQREEAARARSWSSGGSYNTDGSSTPAASGPLGAVVPEASTSNFSKIRRSGAGTTGKSVRTKAGSARAEDQRVRTESLTKAQSFSGNNFDRGTLSLASFSGKYDRLLRAQNSSCESAGVERRLESLEVHMAKVLRCLVSLERRAPCWSHKQIDEQESSTQGLTSGDTSS